MKYYFCIMIPYENTDITEYETLEQLKKDNKQHIKRYNDWYVIKGEELSETEAKTLLK